MPYHTLRVNQRAIGKFKTLEVELHRPEVRNAFNDQVIAELTRVFQKEANAADVGAIVFKGVGKVFCAGGDINWMKDSIDLSVEENFQDALKLAKMFQLINRFPKPVIGAIQGAAIGGGVGLVSVCDIAIASEETVFSLSEARLGLIPACIAPFVIAKIGFSHARGLFMSAERFTAPKAKEVGLIHQTVPSEAELPRQVDRVLENIALCGPLAMKAAKESVFQLGWPEERAALKNPLEYVAKLLADLRASPEGQEGTRAFLEKRKPSWVQ